MADQDFRQSIRKHEEPLQELMEAIPGFDGYREREIRRTADKILRDHLVSRLDEVRQSLKGIIATAARTGVLEGIEELDRQERLLSTARDSLRFADYGYTGFFDAVKIREAELDRLYEYDATLAQAIEACCAAVTALGAADATAKPAALTTLETATGSLQGMIDRRGEVATSLVAPE